MLTCHKPKILSMVVFGFLFMLGLSALESCKSGTKFSDSANPRQTTQSNVPIKPDTPVPNPKIIGPNEDPILIPEKIEPVEEPLKLDNQTDQSLEFISIPPTEHRIEIPAKDSIRLPVVVRDFSDKHPDFEAYLTNKVTKGLVESHLDKQGKPTFIGTPGFTITNAQTFSQWYRTIEGVNHAIKSEIELKRIVGTEVFAHHSASFFPIDKMGFGNEGRIHNYHYTVEIESEFTYQGSEEFTFRGDDDIWVFIDGRLVVDLGGTHQESEQSVDLSTLGLTKGKRYPFKFFYAERHTTQANFNLETSILLNVSKPYIYQAALEGLGDATVKFKLEKFPKGMSIDSKSGLVSWVAGIAELGTHQVKIQATASDNREAVQEFTLKVIRA